MSRARSSLVITALVVLATVATAACVIGPKHDDPSAATPADAGSIADTGFEPHVEVGGPPGLDAADPLDAATPDAPPDDTDATGCTTDAADACGDASADALDADADDADPDAATDAVLDAEEAGG